MAARFAELDWAQTPIGEISLRRRRDPVVGIDVYEVKLGDEFLMSSLFTAAEVELARLGLAAVAGGPLTVLVAGLGLGYTARAALDDPRVGALTVVEALAPVIDWHRRDLVPDTRGLAADPRCSLMQGDFFALLRAGACPGPVDVLLVDIDHSPRHVLDPSHAGFYTADGLRQAAAALTARGALALWSDDPPDPAFERELASVFARVASHVVEFANPLASGTSANTVYIVTGGPAS